MLNELSWSDYFAWLAAILFCYYLVIIFFYYREEFKDSIRPRGQTTFPVTKSDQSKNLTFDDLEQIVKNIDSIIVIAGKEADKTELLHQLKNLLSGFCGLEIPAWKVALYNHIINEAAEQCGIMISEGELDSMG